MLVHRLFWVATRRRPVQLLRATNLATEGTATHGLVAAGACDAGRHPYHAGGGAPCSGRAVRRACGHGGANRPRTSSFPLRRVCCMAGPERLHVLVGMCRDVLHSRQWFVDPTADRDRKGGFARFSLKPSVIYRDRSTRLAALPSRLPILRPRHSVQLMR